MAQSGLIIRRSVRHDVVMPAKVRVGPEHAEAVRYAKGVADAEGWISVDLVDFATGGAGFISTVYLPRGLVLELQILGRDTTPGLTIAKTRVVRVQMTDRRPAYLVGVAYIDTDEKTTADIDAMLTRIDGGAV